MTWSYIFCLIVVISTFALAGVLPLLPLFLHASLISLTSGLVLKSTLRFRVTLLIRVQVHLDMAHFTLCIMWTWCLCVCVCVSLLSVDILYVVVEPRCYASSERKTLWDLCTDTHIRPKATIWSTGLTIGSNLGYTVWPKHTLTCGKEAGQAASPVITGSPPQPTSLLTETESLKHHRCLCQMLIFKPRHHNHNMTLSFFML